VLFFSDLDRTCKSSDLALIVAEYMLGLIPRGTQ